MAPAAPDDRRELVWRYSVEVQMDFGPLADRGPRRRRERL